MAGGSRTVNAIVVPVKTDVSGFSKGLVSAKKEAQKTSQDISKQFSLMGTGILDVQGKLNKLGKTNLGTITKSLSGLTSAAIASAAAITTLGFNRIGEVAKEAENLNVTTEALSKLRAVARASGTDFGDLSKFVAGLDQSITDSIGKTTNAAEAFKALGTSAEALAMKTPEEQIKLLNKGFANLPSETEKTRVAMLLAGEDGGKVFRLLTLGVEEFTNTYNNANLVTDKDVDEFRKLQKTINEIKDAVVTLAEAFTTYVIPPIRAAVGLLDTALSKMGLMQGEIKVGHGGNTGLIKALQAKGVNVNASSFTASKPGGSTIAKPSTPVVPGQAVASAEAMKNRAQLLLEGKRLAAISKQVNDLRQEYRQSIEGGGKDDIHRRIDQIKGITPDQRNTLLKEGYQAREADRTSSLRDELQESTKLPAEKLREDLARINKMVALGAKNGGLTQLQGIRAAAQKTTESGLAGGEPKFAGALQANSIEGRSYLLSQMNRVNDPVEVARQGLALTGQGNNLLGRILNQLQGGREVMATF
jgi:hypothetical protein